MAGRGRWCRGIGRGWRTFFVVVVVRFVVVFWWRWRGVDGLLNRRLEGKGRSSRGGSSCGFVVDSHGLSLGVRFAFSPVGRVEDLALFPWRGSAVVGNLY